MISLLPTESGDTTWLDGIDVDEYHQMDFDEVRRRGTAVVIVRAGRGTRQDSRWIEHVRAAEQAGLAVGSYWYLYPSHTDAHHQAALWMAAIAGAPSLCPAGHWLHVATTDGLDTRTFARYVDACLHRMDDLQGRPTGVSADTAFWRHHVQLDLGERPWWECSVSTDCLPEPQATGEPAGAGPLPFGHRTRPSDRGGPGHHLVRRTGLRPPPLPSHGLHLVVRGPNESIAGWQRRWLRTPDVAVLQRHLNELGAGLVVDGVYGPATDAAVQAWRDLCRRDLIGQPAMIGRPTPLPTTDRTAHR